MIAVDGNADAATRRYDPSGFLDSTWQILGSRFAFYAASGDVDSRAGRTERRRDPAPCAATRARNHGDFAA